MVVTTGVETDRGICSDSESESALLARENCRELRTAVGTTRAVGDGAPLQTTYHITRTHPLSVASSLLPFFLDPIKALSHPLEKHWGNSTSQWCPTTNMKTVAIILALAVITGCNGRAVRQQVATPTQWEAAVNRFWQYISDLNVQADGVLQNLKASQLSRELDTLISDSMAELTAYSENLQTKLSEQTSSTQLAQDMQLLANKLQKDMLDAKDRTTSYLGELTTMVELNTDDVRDRVGTYATKLKKRLDKDTEQIRNTVAAYAEELQSRTSQNLDAARQHVEPYVNQASDSANKKMVDISTSLQTQVEVLGKELMTQTDVFKTQLEATAEELRVSLEGKIDELKELFAPMATQIREQFETIIDKATETASL